MNTPINPQALLNHFKTLNETNITPDLTNIPNISLPYFPEIDDEITYDEVKQSSPSPSPTNFISLLTVLFKP